MDKKINTQKILEMCLLHDISEARISDLNYVHQKYTERFEEKAIEDLIEPLPFGDDIKQTLIEYKKKDCKEALLVKDADNLELLLSLKEQLDIGNLRVKTWIPSLLKRLKTKEGEALAKMILSTDYDEWWFSADSKKDVWWIDRKKK